jgi:hypothetical protein
MKLWSWRKYQGAVTDIVSLVKASVEASKDGVVTEKEAQDLGLKVIAIGYKVKDLI